AALAPLSATGAGSRCTAGVGAGRCRGGGAGTARTSSRVEKGGGSSTGGSASSMVATVCSIAGSTGCGRLRRHPLETDVDRPLAGLAGQRRQRPREGEGD